YVGTTTQTGYSQNVTIKDVRLDNNHRQGISVISVQNMLIDNAVILNTNGTAPEAGIDFEVNYNTQRIFNVQVRNSVIYANHTWGILFAGHADLVDGPITVDIENVTILGNHADGIRMYHPLPGVTIKDSLVVGNDGYGFRGTPVTSDLVQGEISGEGPPRNSIDTSVLWDNASGGRTGWTRLGAGAFTNVEPIFHSLDPDDPYFLYLDLSNPAVILHGGHDGGYLGARPVYVPEPSSAWGLLLLGGMMLHRK
ncbi:MAG TPA: right-handed parallel beta-helix repeat-containing protein, partial [Phycisphaeraceae bacterium]